MAANCVWALVLLECLLVSAQTTPSEDIDNDLPGISISQSNKADPTKFDIFCFNRYQWPDGGTLISLEISLLPDKQPLIFSPFIMPSDLPTWRQIAYLDRFSSNKIPRINPNLAEKGVTARTDSFSVSFNGGTCEDTGLYRCKAVYLPVNQTTFKVKVSEARLPACLPGALAPPVTTKWLPFPNGRRRSDFVCRADSSLVVELVSLEVSVVRNGSRQVLAYINSFLSDARVSYSSGEVQVTGSIYPLSPERSSLSVIQMSDFSEERSQYITTCKAVYSGRNMSDNPIVSMADGKMWFRK